MWSEDIAYINSSCIYGVFITRCKLLDTFRNRKVRLHLQQSPHSFEADFWPDETKMEGQQNDERSIKSFPENCFHLSSHLLFSTSQNSVVLCTYTYTCVYVPAAECKCCFVLSQNLLLELLKQFYKVPMFTELIWIWTPAGLVRFLCHPSSITDYKWYILLPGYSKKVFPSTLYPCKKLTAVQSACLHLCFSSKPKSDRPKRFLN